MQLHTLAIGVVNRLSNEHRPVAIGAGGAIGFLFCLVAVRAAGVGKGAMALCKRDRPERIQIKIAIDVQHDQVAGFKCF